MARRFKDILGEKSEGWRAIRLAAVRRLIKTNTVNGNEIVSGSKTLRAVNDAIEKNGTLVDVLFTRQEIGLLRRLLPLGTQPDLVRSRENPSGTAQVASKGLADIVKKLGIAFGDVVLLGAATGAKKAQGIRAVTKAKSATKEFKPFQSVKPSATATGTGAATQGREDQ